MNTDTALSYGELRDRLRAYAARPRQHAAPVWKARAFRANAGKPMTVRRAEALNAVLESTPLLLTPGELLIGTGNLGRFVAAGTCSDASLAAARDELAAVGERTFASHANHHASDYATLVAEGFGGLRRRARTSLAGRDAAGRTFLESVIVALDGATAYMRRWAAALAETAVETPARAELLRAQSAMMFHLAEGAPRSFWEALQLVYSYHTMMQLDGRGAMAFGRMDQYLFGAYRSDLASGAVTPETVQDLLDHFFAKITVDEDVQNIVLGGTRPCDGEDATNDLSYQILEACRRVGRPGGNCTARIHRHTPQAFLLKCAEVIRTGIGYPAVTNEEPIIRGLLDHGYPLEDARDYCCVGCIETQIAGRQAPWADGRSNPLHALNLAVFRGLDSLTGDQTGPDTGDSPSFEGFYQAFLTHARRQIAALIAAADARQRPCDEQPERYTSPLLSALVADCIERGRDVNDGGARYPACFGYAAMGIASVADSLCAVKRFVYEQARVGLDELRAMLQADFEGFEEERQLLLRGAPKFGNDNDEVDRLAARVVRDLAAEYRRYRTPQGGFYYMLMGSNIQNIAAGREVGATPDGRRAREPVSDACSPTFGRDTRGPTAAIRSVGKIPFHLAVGGNVVNMKLDPDALQGEDGLQRLAALIRACFDLGGQELQFNTTGAETLRRAVEQPERYEGLVVRVSGFSATYVRLDRAVQEDILARTEHRL